MSDGLPPPARGRREPSPPRVPAGPMLLGQIVCCNEDGSPIHELRHRDDAARPASELILHRDPEEAAQLALYDDAGAYRPLKTAPNLRHGWRLVVAGEAALRLALDLFYPARLGAWAAFEDGNLRTTALRDTLGRQTGMYRVAGKLTGEQADALVGRFCRSDGGCLRTILWRRDAAGTVPSTRLPPEKFDPAHDQTGAGRDGTAGFIPLLCQEACNLLVAEARAVVKGERAEAPQTP